ncbi:MAG: hypothetical protein FWG50_10595 [Kiritimatiellaeota bacterium]|nr:hypothetical protein [Kiritimatiellota bacterium]
MKFHHFGVPLAAKRDDMNFGSELKVWFTDPFASPHKIEFLWFEPECPLAASVQNGPHVAYEVENIEEAVMGKSVLFPVTELVPGFKIAFIYDGGIPVELMQLAK